MDGSTFFSDAASVATAVGVLFGAAQLLLSRGQARTAFEDQLTAQYRGIIKPALSEELLAPLGADKQSLIRPYYEYFDLCNEQVFLRMQGRVGRRTWREWQQGISANLTRGLIAEAWDAVADAPQGFEDFDELRLLHRSGFVCDPRSWNPLWRRVLRQELWASNAAIQRRALRSVSQKRV
ncbi:MAG: hypothetical protein M3Q08_17415 [Pseudomonadota bacterium]|nr:hypothetical protein [Pseudomonadota bacterium]